MSKFADPVALTMAGETDVTTGAGSVTVSKMVCGVKTPQLAVTLYV